MLVLLVLGIALLVAAAVLATAALLARNDTLYIEDEEGED